MTVAVKNSEHVAAAPDPDIGGRLRELRVQQGLSQRELSRRAGLAHAAISQIEKNRVSPSVASLRKVVGALGLSLGEFFREEEERRPVFFAAEDLPEVGAGEVSVRRVGPAGALQLTVRTYPAGAEAVVDPGADWRAGPDSTSGPDSGAGSRGGEVGGVVVSGRITATVGGETRVLGPGDGYRFPGATPHRFRNEGPQACSIICASIATTP